LRLTIETVKERQESELLNNAGYGLLKNVPPAQHITTRKGAPTPTTWMNCSPRFGRSRRFFWPIRVPSPPLGANARDAAFHRQPSPCSVPLPDWRGVPLVPCDKIHVDGQTKPTGPVERPAFCSCASVRKNRA